MVSVLQVLLQALLSFSGHLDTVLEDGDREGVRRIRGQPQTEVAMGGPRITIDVLTDLLERRHPAD